MILLLLLSSCAAKKDIYYFQGDQSILDSISKYSPTLKPDDLLIITVSALDLESTLPFNLQSPYKTTTAVTLGTTGAINPGLMTYLIDENGNIDFPVLGKIKLGGLTRYEAMDYMKEKLTRYIKEPSINIQIANFRITILGEVSKPGTYTISNEKITIIEALGLAGDLTIYGKRKDILVVREINGKKTFTPVDLTSKQVFNSPVYYLTQNDVIYVHPTNSRRTATYSVINSMLISLTGLALSIITFLTR